MKKNTQNLILSNNSWSVISESFFNDAESGPKRNNLYLRSRYRYDIQKQLTKGEEETFESIKSTNPSRESLESTQNNYIDDIGSIDQEDESDLTDEELANDMNVKKIVCSMKFYHAHQPHVRRGYKPWNRSETIILLRGMLKFNTDFKTIIKEFTFSPPRQFEELRSRYRIIKKQLTPAQIGAFEGK